MIGFKKEIEKLKVGSRGSRLALAQVEEVFCLLSQQGFKVEYENVVFDTRGDKDKQTSLLENPADNFFTDTIDRALLNGGIDIAVHSAKDLPQSFPEGLKILALTAPLDETDAFVGKTDFADLPSGSRVGTSSLLRRESIKRLNPLVEPVDIRGTIEERLALLEQNVYDGLIVATCALKRLGLEGKIKNIMPWPATPLQGQLAVVGRREAAARLSRVFSAIDARRTYGCVTLVGAGPGDPELITLKGIRALEKADCVFYDYLVDQRLLEHAPRAEKIYAGKRKGEHSLAQTELSRMLREKACSGKNVVRLKGGDPLVFGRGADELEYLRAYHIEVKIVPGITSATGLPSVLGIPLTARGVSSSVAFLSGHREGERSASDELLDIPKADTVVFLMGLTKLSLIVRSLRKAGWPETTPVMVISRGTRSDEKIVCGTVADIEAISMQEGLEPPALIVIGAIVRFYKKDSRGADKILYLGTYPEKYRPLGDIIHVPAIKILPVEWDVKRLNTLVDELSRSRFLIFTSRFAVRFFFELLQKSQYPVDNLKTLEIAVIGRDTAAALKSYGFHPAVVAAVETSEGLLAALQKHYDFKGKKVLFPRSALPNPFLKEELVKLGAEVNEITVYQNVKAERVELPLQRINKVLFTSPSTVKNFLDYYGVIPRHWQILSKGSRTSDALKEAGYQSEVLVYE